MEHFSNLSFSNLEEYYIGPPSRGDIYFKTNDQDSSYWDILKYVETVEDQYTYAFQIADFPIKSSEIQASLNNSASPIIAIYKNGVHPVYWQNIITTSRKEWHEWKVYNYNEIDERKKNIARGNNFYSFLILLYLYPIGYIIYLALLIFLSAAFLCF